ncbi:MAG: hypothetical protein NWE83_10745 [Candidatus Bathyarchaeota archaeon]|nr:hypothetical protein [Candidatus Bathyarchaeota archaeon]
MEPTEYDRLAGALDRLPNGFPCTDSGVELEILRRIFSPEEAHIASLLNRSHKRYELIAQHARASGAAQLHRKPENQIERPPQDFAAWE